MCEGGWVSHCICLVMVVVCRPVAAVTVGWLSCGPCHWCCRHCHSLPLPSLSLPPQCHQKATSTRDPLLQAVACSGRGRCWVVVLLAASIDPHWPLAPSNPPCEQLLAAVEVGAGVLVVWPCKGGSGGCLVPHTSEYNIMVFSCTVGNV